MVNREFGNETEPRRLEGLKLVFLGEKGIIFKQI